MRLDVGMYDDNFKNRNVRYGCFYELDLDARTCTSVYGRCPEFFFDGTGKKRLSIGEY